MRVKTRPAAINKYPRNAAIQTRFTGVIRSAGNSARGGIRQVSRCESSTGRASTVGRRRRFMMAMLTAATRAMRDPPIKIARICFPVISG